MVDRFLRRPRYAASKEKNADKSSALRERGSPQHSLRPGPVLDTRHHCRLRERSDRVHTALKHPKFFVRLRPRAPPKPPLPRFRLTDREQSLRMELVSQPCSASFHIADRRPGLRPLISRRAPLLLASVGCLFNIDNVFRRK